jgi:putative transposase
VDTLGLILEVVVHSASIQDRDGAKLVFRRIRKYFTKLTLIWADGAYAGKLVAWVNRYHGWTLTIVKRTDRFKGFIVVPKRWIVERTFAWLNKYRRLSKDYEYYTDTSETMIYLAMTHVMVRRLRKK